MTPIPRGIATASFVGLLTLTACEMKFGSQGDSCTGPNYSVRYVYLDFARSDSVSIYVAAAGGVELGDSLIAEAEATGEDCRTVGARHLSRWSTPTPTTLTVTPPGPTSRRAIVRTHGIGTGYVRVAIQGVTGERQVTVVQRIATVELDPVPSTVQVFDSIFVRARAIDIDGNPVTQLPIDYWVTSIYGDRGFQADHVALGFWVQAWGPGPMVISADLLGHTDTLSVTVVARASNTR